MRKDRDLAENAAVERIAGGEPDCFRCKRRIRIVEDSVRVFQVIP